jgi:hypothetical protein
VAAQSATPFPLGVYIGNPNPGDPAQEAAFEASYTSFSTLMGAAPQFIDVYIDSDQPISNWVAAASAQAWADSASPDAKGMAPVIGLPMTSTAPGSLTPDQYYKNFAAGDYDAIIEGMVKAWAAEGFTTQYWRPGYEMNLPGMPSYEGSDPATQADWVAAFQHISTVLHAAGVADGVNVQVIWNPAVTNYGAAPYPLQTAYPGNQYVDIIGADVYGDIYTYGSPTALYDWDKSGQVLNSSQPVYDGLQQWAADPINLEHYYTNPAATQSSLDGSGGSALSLQSLLAFAKAQGKPIAIAETGAGNTADGAGVSDNPTFVQWLATTLEDSGVAVSFVNIWDSNGGGNYEFSFAADDKPQEAAAWARFFGVPSLPTLTVGSGPDTIALSMSEDFYLADAQFTVSVDGKQVGGTESVTAAHALGQTQTVDIDGNFGAGTHVVAIDFLNDAYGGSVATDRNLYVTAASYDGVAAPGASLTLATTGTQSLTVGTPVKPKVYNTGAAGGVITTATGDTVNMGRGAVTVHAAGASVTVNGGAGAMTFIGGTGADKVVAATGKVAITANADTLAFTAGHGSETIVADSGVETYTIVNGSAGGAITIANYNPVLDAIDLHGYAAGTVKQTVSGGSTRIVLSDSTTITLVGTALSSSAVHFV